MFIVRTILEVAGLFFIAICLFGFWIGKEEKLFK
jgi:hypothetical protein